MSTTRITITDSRGNPWGRLVRSLTIIAAVFGPGILFGSSAMQWAGFTILAVFAISLASNTSKTMTIDEAIDYLRKMDHK